ncbi:tripartite tricarboxylate transporter permease [Halomonas sp. AOP27-A1-41]|uniref:tripartite tricarboxylate transporter permease n=1 Tax=Halomonas sp. AOP27-A1-41 TaxID=3457707 RepID=UPI00403340BC
MFDSAPIMEGLLLLADWKVLAVMVLGVFFGIITGAIPGFSTPLAISIMLPLTYPMSPIMGITFLTAIYAGGNFGSSIPSILLNIPGSPQAIVTGFDGHPMTKQGRANEALGMAVSASTVGNLLGAFFLILVMPLIVAAALMFGPPELFLVGVLGLTVIATLHSSFLKAIISGAFGVLLGTIGMTSTGAIRGTHGYFELMDGLPVMPALIGLIGFSELYYMLQQRYIARDERGQQAGMRYQKLMAGVRETFKHPVTVLKSSAIGVIIGALPGAGGTVASVVSYNEAKRSAKNSEVFGKGASQGLISAESSNNASEGGALATMLSLGIPGGMATAVMAGALMLQGLIPGPRLFIDSQGLVYGVMFSLFIATIFLLVAGLLVSFYATRVVNVPTKVLIPLVAVLSIVGTYAVNLQMFDVKIMLVFATLGILMRKYDYPLIAVILGIILGPILDSQLLRTFQGAGDISLDVFLARPVSIILLGIIIFCTAPILLKLYRSLRVILTSSSTPKSQ